jgi:beta-galactosidase/beta-glucuronidase
MAMKKLCYFILILSFSSQGWSQWKPAGNKIMTEWAAKVDPRLPHPEYPRPQMKRGEWMNLNGSWDYAIRYKEEAKPSQYQGKILVPFAIESALSGVGKTVGENNQLWYRRTVQIPSAMRGKKLLLHFGAVDWEAEIFINGKSAGLHKGGYDPFSIDITRFLTKKAAQEIMVRVWDPTDKGPQAHGKQVSNPSGIWYTPVTGIWQTVWLEAVPETYIESLYTIPNLDASTITVNSNVKNMIPGDRINIRIHEKGNLVQEQSFEQDSNMVIRLNNVKPWSPSSPNLYDLTLTVTRSGKKIDEIESYFAMRKISLEKDARGIQWMMLNNSFVFQYGPLDQGWWPDGLYTAPTAEALLYDVVKTREMGFNMIRKHVKVEPANWYRYCDSLGMLVWQDMPSGDMNFNTDKWITNPSLEPIDKTRTEESEQIYRMEWKSIMDALRPFPSIVVWVPFNEAWGQFKTAEITNWTKQYDPSRLVNPASGGNFHAVGDIHDLHNYPDPQIHRPEVFGLDRAVVLGEFGGLGLPVENHTWTDKSNWGYQSFRNKEELFSRYQQLIEKLVTMIPKGMSAAVYTQTTDVESEVNGLMTYDRKVIKFNMEEIRKLNQKLYNVKR